MQSLLIKSGSILVIVALIFMAGWYACIGWYRPSYNAMAKELNAAQAKNQQMSDFYNQILNQNQPAQNKVDREVKVEIQKYPVYVDCKYTADGMQSIKSTVDQTNKTLSAQ